MSNPGRFKSVWKGLWLNRTEEKLSDAEERYHAIFDQAADSILVTDIDTGEIIDFNCQAYETLGYTREEFVKLKIGDFDPSFKRERTRMQEFREKGLKHTFLTKNRTKSGEFRDVLVTIQAIHIGGKVMMMNIWHDITETKKAEEALRDNEERMKAIVRNAPIGIATSGADRYFLSANEEFSRIIGYTEAELQKMSFKDITHPEDIEESALKMGDLDAGKVASFSQEKRYIKKDGNVIIGKVIVSAVRGHEQRPRIYVVHLEDITDQKAAEQALRESEEKFSQAFNSASDAMAIRSAPGGKFIAVNDNYVKLTGYSREELINRTTDELNMSGRPADRPILLGALAEKGRMFQLEFLLRKKSGEIRTCLSSTEPITIGGKKCWIGVIQDITEKKAVEQALRESEEKFSQAFNAASDAMVIRSVPAESSSRSMKIM